MKLQQQKGNGLELSPRSIYCITHTCMHPDPPKGCSVNVQTSSCLATLVCKAVMVVCGGLIIPEAQQCCTTFTTLFFPWWRSVGFLDYLETSSNQPTGITVTVASSQTCTQLSVACIKCWQAVWGWKKGCRDRASLLRIAHSLTLIRTGA